MLEPALLLWLREKLPELLRPLLDRLVEERLKKIPKPEPQKIYLGGGAGGSSGGVTSHGALTGLGADDHPQYHTDGRGDARYSPLNHDHAGAYDPLNAAASAVATHEANPDPHPFYVTVAEAAAAAPVQSVGGKTGSVTLAIADTEGLGVALDGKQPLDPDLTAVAGLSGVGFVVRTADGQMAIRSLAYNLGIAITSANGVSNAPMIANTDRGSIAVASHEFAADPHTQYQNQARADARYLTLAGGTLTGAITFGANNPNPAVRARHIDGKEAAADVSDTLYLNYSAAGKGVVIGDTGTDHPLTVNGTVAANGLVRSNRAWDGVTGGLHLSGHKPSVTLWDTDQGKKWLFHCAADSLFFYRAATASEAATDWAYKFSIASNGVVASAALSGTGNRAVYSDAGGALTNSASDRRLKKEIAPAQHGLAEVLRLAPVTFRWKDARMGGQRELGLIAQDVRPIVPEVVGRNADSMLSLDYAKLVPVLVRAIQELNERLARANL